MGLVSRFELLPAETPATGMTLERASRASLRGVQPPAGLSRWSLAPGAASPLDQHEDEEIWLIASGQGTVTRDGSEVTTVRGGDVIDLPSEVSHTLKNTGDQPLIVFSVWWR